MPDNMQRAADLIAVLREVAERSFGHPGADCAAPGSSITLAVAAIPGASNVGQVEENAAAADIELTDDQYQALQAASDRFRPVTGSVALPRRYLSGLKGWVTSAGVLDQD